MALDRPDDFEAADGRPERYFRGGPPGGDVPRGEPAETRSRSECYEALRAADGDSSDAADSGEGRSGWDSVEDPPPAENIRISPERGAHILDGEPDDGGGHRHGTGKEGKTEFPVSWNDEKVMDNVLDVARRPDSPPVLQQFNKRWFCSGIREGVEISVIVLRSGDVWTAWPEEGGPGVVRNPRKETI
jgi:EndoU nuclease-like protein